MKKLGTILSSLRFFGFLFCCVTAAWANGPHRVLVLGDSITEGYGVSKEDSYPTVLQGIFNSEGKKEVTVINAGIGGSTTASGVSRLKWALQGKPDILVLALGGNDALRGLKPEETRENLQRIVTLAQENGMKVLIAGMKAPPNYGEDYTKRFERSFSEVAQGKKISLMPFLLEGVAGDTSLNQADGIHPNEKGHQIIAKNMHKYLERIL